MKDTTKKIIALRFFIWIMGSAFFIACFFGEFSFPLSLALTIITIGVWTVGFLLIPSLILMKQHEEEKK